MALAKDPNGNFLVAGSSPDQQVSDLSCPGIYRFDQTGDSSEKASVFVKNSSMMSTKGYVFDATNYQPVHEEARVSLINFKAANGHDPFVHRDAGSSNLVSFVHKELDHDQESDHDQDEYSSLWENFNSYQTPSSAYVSMMSNIDNASRENQHGDQEIFGLFFNEATHTIDSNNIPGTQIAAASCNKRQGDMGESMQALKKQCTGAITKKPKPKTVSCSKDPQSIAAKNRRERISERLKVLQELVPNGTKVDLVTMLEKAISYVKFLQLQVKVLATDDFWPAQGGKAPEISQVKEAIDAILSSQRGRD